MRLFSREISSRRGSDSTTFHDRTVYGSISCSPSKSIADQTRNIYYQNPELFRSQSIVDDMVDNLACTLGVGREDLNIVGI